MLHGGMGGYVMKVVAIELPGGHFVQLRPQLHYTGLHFIPDCLNPIRYENIGSYIAPLRLFLRSVPGIHYAAHIGLGFVSPPVQSDFAPTCCTGSLRDSVNETLNRHEY